jgi:transcriptional regulator with XRE-family HTH domain
MVQNRSIGWSSGAEGSLLMGIGLRVAAARLQRNITQQKLADEAGVSRSTVRRLEGGESVQLSAFLRVLRALDLLEGLDLLLPDATVSPLHVLEHQGQKRKRASGPKTIGDSASKPWQWGEDQ